MSRVSDLLEIVSLFCPDDKARLEITSQSLACPSCKRSFPIHQNRLIELLPKAASIDRSFWQRYADSYAEESNKPFVWDKAAMAWRA